MDAVTYITLLNVHSLLDSSDVETSKTLIEELLEIKKAFQEPTFHQGTTQNQKYYNTNNEIRKVRLINNDDYLDLIRFLDSIQILITNDKQSIAIDMLEHKKKVLEEKIEEDK